MYNLFMNGKKVDIDEQGFKWCEDMTGRYCRVGHCIQPTILKSFMEDDKLKAITTGGNRFSKPS